MVSVIIPAFNRGDMLRRAVESVLGQQGVEFELIVVDDASDEPDERLYGEVESAGHSVVRLPRNGGPGPARNTGAALARGEWLAFLDSDDHWLPEKLSRHLRSLERSGRRVGQTDEIWYRHGERVNPPAPHRISGGDLFERSLRAVCVSSSTVMLERELFLEVGGFDPALFVCEDYDLWLRVSAREAFDHLAAPLVVKYGGHADQLSRALPAMDRFRALAILKGLAGREWGERQAVAVAELDRKLRILSKGAKKRGLTEAVELCERVAALAREARFGEALAEARLLSARWPERPDVIGNA